MIRWSFSSKCRRCGSPLDLDGNCHTCAALGPDRPVGVVRRGVVVNGLTIRKPDGTEETYRSLDEVPEPYRHHFKQRLPASRGGGQTLEFTARDVVRQPDGSYTVELPDGSSIALPFEPAGRAGRWRWVALLVFLPILVGIMIAATVGVLFLVLR